MRDHRTAAEIISTPRWTGLRARARIALAEGTLDAPKVRRIDRWLAHVERHAIGRATVEDYLGFADQLYVGGLAELHAALKVLVPGALELRTLEQTVQLKRKQQPPVYRPNGRPQGGTHRVSVPREELPPVFRQMLDDMAAGIARGTIAPAPSIVRTLENKLGQLTWSARRAGVTADLDGPALRAFIDDMKARGVRPSTIGSSLSKLRTAAFYLEADPTLLRDLKTEMAYFQEKAAAQPKRKERALLETGLTSEQIARRAAALAGAAPDEPNAKRRNGLRMRAALYALVLCRPLRAADLGRLRIGEQLRRDAQGWRLDIEQQKTGVPLRGPLWPSVTPYMDAALLGDTAQDAFEQVYAQARGQPFFRTETGKPYCYAWATQCFEQDFGIGIHITRTLCHEEAARRGNTGAAVAAVLCGHATLAAAEHYRTEAGRRRLREDASRLLKAIEEWSG